MALNSSDVSAGDDILAAHNNNLIDDIEQHTHDGTDTAAVTQLNNSVTFASAITRYLVLGPASFVRDPINSVSDWVSYIERAQADGTDVTAGLGGINLPNGAIVTSFKIYWFRNDAAASGSALLSRRTLVTGVGATMATANSDATTGNHSVEDTSIAFATIDNTTYWYHIEASMNPNDTNSDVYFRGAIIAYTIVVPLT